MRVGSLADILKPVVGVEMWVGGSCALQSWKLKLS
jgi:hypothetical protein